MKINVQIERLILDGLDLAPHQRPVLRAALESELARLLTVDGLNQELAAGGAWPELRAASVQMASSNNPERVGHEIAQAVYKGIGQ
ncbi:MAG: hypothetical protein AABO41_07720 [Acidobacteriota bacterium]